MAPLEYNDTVVLVDTKPDGYGTEVITNSESISAIVLMDSGYSHGGNQDSNITTAAVYLDPTDSFVIANSYRLEEMLVSIQLFATSSKLSWYKIKNVQVNRDVLLSNQIETIFCELEKTTEVSNAS